MVDELIDKAFKIAVKAHEGQFDKGNKPYILHPVQVSMNFDNFKQKDYVIVSLLHDVVEDSNITLNDLIKCGFSEDVIKAIKAITKNKDETYLDYILRVVKNPIALEVKYYDLKHNSDITRISNPTDNDKARCKKYKFYMSLINAYISIPDHSIFTYFKDKSLMEYLK